MRHIRSFNESNNVFKLTTEDIEDICLEMIDIGFKLVVEHRWINQNGKRSSEPLSKRSTPIYTIQLTREEEDLSSNDYWNGGLFYDKYDTLRSFLSIIKRLESYGEARYHISGDRYSIQLNLEPIETEIGFDWHFFTQEMGTFVNSLNKNYQEKEEDDLYHLHDRYGSSTISSRFSSGDELTYEIRTLMDRDESMKLAFEGVKNNKGMYVDIIKLFKKKIAKFGDRISADFNFSWVEPKKFHFKRKNGLFSKEEKEFTFYTLTIRIKETKKK